MHKHIRVSILLLILAIISVGTYATRLRVTDWSHTLRVVIYPINGDQSEAAERHINALDNSHFEPIKQFFKEELDSYQLPSDDIISIDLASEVMQLPPVLPDNPAITDIIYWSLSLRYWAFQRDEYQGPKPEIQLFTLYFDPETSPAVKHSTGLDKGQVAVINLYADDRYIGSNLFVIVHELLHTLGATDKYSMTSHNPVFPDGYAEPELEPLYPQNFAEIMGGRIPISEYENKIPQSLDDVVIGYQTAKEIRLID